MNKPTNQQPSTALIVALTIVACCGIGATALIIITLDKSQLPEGWLALFIGFVGTAIAVVASLAKIDRIGRQVDDLANGTMEAKIITGIADVVKNEHLDPAATSQIEAARARVRREGGEHRR